MKNRPYIGIKHPSVTHKVMSTTKVSTQTHPQFHAVKGPFKTNRGADYLMSHPNPIAMSRLSVNELEKLAAEIAN